MPGSIILSADLPCEAGMQPTYTYGVNGCESMCHVVFTASCVPKLEPEPSLTAAIGPALLLTAILARARRWSRKVYKMYKLISIAVLLCAVPGHAAYLTMTSDAAFYEVGDTITITLVGDSEGASSDWAYAFLIYDPALADPVSFQPGTLGDGWIDGWRPSGDGFAAAWNQVTDGGVDGILLPGAGTSQLVLVAQAPGELELSFHEGSYWFFGATAPTLSLRIGGAVVGEPPAAPPTPLEPPPGDLGAPSVPEPSGALLFAAGLLAATASRRSLGSAAPRRAATPA